MKMRYIILGLACLSLATLLPADEPAPKAQPIDQVVADLHQIGRLLRQLDDPKFEVRQQAVEQLQQIGVPAIVPLQRLLEAKPGLEVVARAQQALDGIKKEKNKGAELRAILAAPINLERGIDPNTPLKDALEFLADVHKVDPIIIDTKAFEAIGVQKVDEQPVQLPKMVSVSVATALRLLVGQLKGGVYEGTYAVRHDHILITTTAHVFSAEFMTPEHRSRIPTVSVEFDRTPLEGALREVADRTGTNVVLDVQVGDKARKAVTARLAQVPVHTAVRLLADMAELRAVAIDNVLYVTTIDKGKHLQAEQDVQRREAERTKKAEDEKPALK